MKFLKNLFILLLILIIISLMIGISYIPYEYHLKFYGGILLFIIEVGLSILCLYLIQKLE